MGSEYLWDMPADIPFGFGPPGGEVPDPNDPRQMQQFLSQLQQLFATPGGGPVNWDLARQLAQAHLTGGGPAGGLAQFPVGFAMPGVAVTPPANTDDPDAAKPVGDPSVTSAERAAVIEALRLADLWLDPESALPSGVRSTAAWSRGEWLNTTLPVWRKLCDPVAARMVSAMTELVPEEMRAQMGPMTSMVASLGGALLGGQLGTALGSLAAEVLSAGDIGLPLGPAGTAALVPANIAEYGRGLEIPDDQVRLYVALREAAHQRLFGHVPWLRGHVFAAVEAYAAGIHVDREAIEEAMSRIDPATLGNDPQELVLEGIFTPEDTPQQRAALARLETALALIEGWVCHVVDRAAGDRLPDMVRLSEAFRRRRAAGGPAEQTFAALVGLELRPRRLREATALWAALAEHRGVAGRDALWDHPDLLPDEEAFADPDLFARTSLDLSDLGFGDETSTGEAPKEGDTPTDGDTPKE
ncbi:zinc-dependent metalloprotease [Dactylosporangium siamense]|uniref:Hydrolase n=2 Tax=Dactylosporangium siamense TaxID=685454 RepID=A0A919PMA2_9ACTN|nr:hydrolase [Dactylosporangium siamense]